MTMTSTQQPTGPKSYYPTFRKNGKTPPKCVVDDKAEASEAVKEIPSPTRARARRAKQAEERGALDGKRATVNLQMTSKMQEAAPLRTALEIDPADLRIGECIGAGTSADVFKASWHGTDVALKRLRGPLPSEFHRELAVLSQMRHPHLVLFMGACTTGPPKIVSELCEGGTLFQLLHQQKETPLSWPQRVKVALDTAKGMNFLHRQRVVHRDLKSLNLLLVAKVNDRADTPWIKVSDFGLSRFLPASAAAPGAHSAALMTGGVGTALWMAPEVLSGNSYDEKVDVYSFAIVLYELLCRWIPFDGSGMEPVSVAIAVTGGRRPDVRYLPVDCPPSLSHMMKSCWSHCANQRPTFDSTLELLKQTQCAP